jgi:hypothetical protein
MRSNKFIKVVGQSSKCPKADAGTATPHHITLPAASPWLPEIFLSIPPNGDIYLMKQVLHDWDEPSALAILKNCRRVVKTSAKLLLAELIIPEAGQAALLGSLLDLHMLVVHCGRERTKDDFVTLLRGSGHTLHRIVATPTPISIIEALPI